LGERIRHKLPSSTLTTMSLKQFFLVLSPLEARNWSVYRGGARNHHHEPHDAEDVHGLGDRGGRYEAGSSVVGRLFGAESAAYIATQVDIISSERVADRVVKILKLDKSPDYIAAWRDSTNGKGDITNWIGLMLKKAVVVTPVTRQ